MAVRCVDIIIRKLKKKKDKTRRLSRRFMLTRRRGDVLRVPSIFAGVRHSYPRRIILRVYLVIIHTHHGLRLV